MEILILSIIFTHCFIVSVWSLGVSFQCPATFENGENILKCTINTSAIREADCSEITPSVSFARTIHSQTTILCQHPYDPDKPCIPVVQHNPGDCWCSKSEGGIFTYMFSYLFDSIQDPGGRLECNLCILPEKPLGLYADESCSNILLAAHKNASATDNSTQPSTSGLPENFTTAESLEAVGVNQPTKIGEIIAGIIAGTVVEFIIIIFVAFIFKKYPKLLDSINRIFCRWCLNSSKKPEHENEDNESMPLENKNGEDKDHPNGTNV